ncbi:hypothetical protein ACFWPX_33345 [Nocardia sp. NPDC058518]|uniref:hypothetical protein n=1 Tax=Nocardia sp. NPDC058518 TaxID=3346534 RepID=UPI0036576B41
MSDQILARYGHLDRALATVVRTSIHSVLIVVVLRLEEAHRKLAGLSKDGAEVCLPDNGPSDRLLVLMVELFGVEHTELLDTELDPMFAQLTVMASRDDHETQRTVVEIFAAVSMFLVAEANMLRRCVDDLGLVDEEVFALIESVAMEAFTLSMTLNRRADEGSWLHLPERVARVEPANETMEAEIGSEACDESSQQDPLFEGPRRLSSCRCQAPLDDEYRIPDSVECLDDDVVWEQLQQVFYSEEHPPAARDPIRPDLPDDETSGSGCQLNAALVRTSDEVTRAAAPEKGSVVLTVVESETRRRIRPIGPWIKLALTCSASVGFVALIVSGGVPPLWAAALVPLWHIAAAGLYGLSGLATPEEVVRHWASRHFISTDRRFILADRRSIH